MPDDSAGMSKRRQRISEARRMQRYINASCATGRRIHEARQSIAGEDRRSRIALSRSRSLRFARLIA
jgi:hypothetical protein